MPRETYRYFPISLNSPPADAASFLEPGKSCGHICGCVIVGMYVAVESWAGLGWTVDPYRCARPPRTWRWRSRPSGAWTVCQRCKKAGSVSPRATHAGMPGRDERIDNQRVIINCSNAAEGSHLPGASCCDGQASKLCRCPGIWVWIVRSVRAMRAGGLWIPSCMSYASAALRGRIKHPLPMAT